MLARLRPSMASGKSMEMSRVTASSLSTVLPATVRVPARLARATVTLMSRAWTVWPVVVSMNENRPFSMRTSASSRPDMGRPSPLSADGGGGGAAGSIIQLGRPDSSTSRKMAGSRITRLSTTTDLPISGNKASLTSTRATEIISGDGMPSALDRRSAPILTLSGSSDTLMSPSMCRSRPVASCTALAMSGSKLFQSIIAGTANTATTSRTTMPASPMRIFFMVAPSRLRPGFSAKIGHRRPRHYELEIVLTPLGSGRNCQ